MKVALALSLVLALAGASAAIGGGSSPSACPATLANGLASTGSARQLLTVVAPRTQSTQTSLELWRKSGGCWLAAEGPWTAWVGRRGVSAHKREGDRTTPAGAFGFGTTMFGLAANPGVHYPYHRIVCGDWWVEDPRSPYYNRFHHVRCGSSPPFRVTSEDMSRSPTAYRQLAVIDYNSHPVVPGRGSGIFLHASTGRATLGCISLPLPELLRLLGWLRPEAAPLIAIGTPAGIRRL